MDSQIPLGIKASVLSQPMQKGCWAFLCPQLYVGDFGCFGRASFDPPESSGKSSFSHSIEHFASVHAVGLVPPTEVGDVRFLFGNHCFVVGRNVDQRNF